MTGIATSIVIVEVDSGVPLAARVDVAAALCIQAMRDIGPAWGLLATVRAETPEHPARPGEWRLELRKTPTTDDALGLHQRSPDGTPVLLVFPPLCKQLGTSWSSCASHEVAEALVDPGCHACTELPDGTVMAVEVADACEQDTYRIGDVEVSDFCTPNYFSPTDSRASPFDYLGLITKPGEVRAGGYSQTYVPGTGWTQHTAEMSPYRRALALLGLGRAARRAA